MPARTTLNVSLTSELADYIGECVGSGQYKSASEVVRESLRIMRHHGPQAIPAINDAFLLRFADRTAPIRDPRRLMAEASFLIGSHLEADRVGYAELTPDRGHFIVSEDWTAGSMQSLAGRYRLEDFGTQRIAKLRKGETVRFDDAAAEPLVSDMERDAERFIGSPNQASISVPLVKDGQLLAFLYVHQRLPRRWTDADENLVKEIALRTWSAVASARADAAMMDSEARFRSIFDSALHLIGLLSIDGTVLEVNRAALAFGGLRAEQITGRVLWQAGFWELAPDPEAKARLKAAVEEAAGGNTVRYDETVGIATGDVATIDFSVRPIRGGTGDMIFLLAEARDVTAEKQAMAKLAESEGRFRAIAESMPQMVWAGDRHGKNVYCNGRFLEFVGLPLSANGLDWAELVHPEDRAESAELRRQTLISGKPFEREHRLRRYDGVYRWVLARAVPAFNAHGEIEIWFGTSTDITELVEARMVLTQSHEELERLVAERTRALKDAALELAAEMRRREEMQSSMLQTQKLEALGHLTGAVAHDFNNVLMAISGSYGLIRRRVDSPKVIELVEHGERAVEKAGKLVGQLLTFVRREELTPKLIDLNKQFESAHDLLRHAVGVGIEFKFDVAAGTHPIIADAYQLEVALLNLAVNARDAMEGIGEIVISARNLAEAGRPEQLLPGDYVAIAIRDTGKGMPPEVIARATEAFFTTKAAGEGTGLGLAMVQGFAARSGGAVRIESEPGAGTVIEIILPQAPIQNAAASDRSDVPPDPALHGDATLLLVDDDEQFRHVTAGFLRELGYAVLEANNAETAMALVQTLSRLDLVLTDQTMPGASGITLITRLRTDWLGLPVQFLTGAPPGPGLAGEAVLRKPISFTALGRAVLERLGRWTPNDADGDRMLRRLKAPALRQLYVNWHASKEPGALFPRLSGIDPLRFGLGPHAFIVAVENSDPVQFRFETVGSALTRRLRRPLNGERIDNPAEDDETLGEIYATYRRCARNLAPVYEAARFNFGDGAPLHLERIVLPVSENGTTITHLVGIALFTEPGNSTTNTD